MYTAKAENSNISLFHEYDVTCVQVFPFHSPCRFRKSITKKLVKAKIGD